MIYQTLHTIQSKMSPDEVKRNLTEAIKIVPLEEGFSAFNNRREMHKPFVGKIDECGFLIARNTFRTRALEIQGEILPNSEGTQISLKMGLNRIFIVSPLIVLIIGTILYGEFDIRIFLILIIITGLMYLAQEMGFRQEVKRAKSQFEKIIPW